MEVNIPTTKIIFTLLINFILISCNSTKYINISKIKMEAVVQESSTGIEKVIINNEGRILHKECETIDISYSINQSNIINFKSKFNIYDMSYNCYNSERRIYNVFHNLDKILSKLKYSHFIIENQRGDFIILDENLKNENVVLFQDCAFKYFNSDLSKNDTPYITSTSICISDLKIEPTDKAIRIYYFFKPNKKIDKDKAYKTTLFISNWIYIDNVANSKGLER